MVKNLHQPAPQQKTLTKTVKPAAGKLTPAQITALFKRWKKQNPAPRSELIYHNPFELLIAVMLSAQATDKSVNLVTPQLFSAAPTAAAMLALGLANITALIKTIGLFNSKAKHIFQTCGILVEQYDGQVPATRSELEALPGVGRKTANVVLNVAFGESTLAVDTHIFRVANRTGLASGKTPLAVEQQLLACIPATFLPDAHHWLILHGRYVCKARKPECGRCLIQDLCLYPNKVYDANHSTSTKDA